MPAGTVDLTHFTRAAQDAAYLLAGALRRTDLWAARHELHQLRVAVSKLARADESELPEAGPGPRRGDPFHAIGLLFAALLLRDYPAAARLLVVLEAAVEIMDGAV